MRTRRAHHKSRNGCATCKKRRVKCDEKGPPCGNCKIKSLECLFPEPPRSSDNSVSKSLSAEPELSETSKKSSDDRLLELELMHQWSTSTYRSMCGDYTVDDDTWQVLIPREALKYDYMLDCMLALAALEIAMADTDKKKKSTYIQKALIFQDRASQRFRSEIQDVPDITEENHLSVFVFSVFMIVYSLAVPQLDHSNITESICFQYDLLRGTAPLSQHAMGWLKKGPFKAHMDMDKLPGVEAIEKLDSDTRKAVERLKALNDSINIIHGSQLLPDQKPSPTHTACKLAAHYLSWLFAISPEPRLRGLALVFLNLAGADYVQAIKDENPVALLLLMHWGVLVQRVAYDLWWARTMGRDLVEELSLVLQPSDAPELKDSVLWARGQVGLDVLKEDETLTKMSEG